MNRRQRMRAVTYACYVGVAASFGWQAASHGWRAAAASAVWMLVVMLVLLVILFWIDRGER